MRKFNKFLFPTDGEKRRVWRGNTKEGNKQLFRLLRLQSSPTLRRAVSSLECEKRRKMKCSRCHRIGHTRANRKCPLFDQEVGSDDLEVATGIAQEEEEFFDNASIDDNSDTSTIEAEDDYECEEVIETTIIVDENESFENQNQCNTF